MTDPVAQAEAMLARGGRVLGIAGPPGSGKSTLAEQLLRHFGTRAALLPMDGFHMANEELHRLGRACGTRRLGHLVGLRGRAPVLQSGRARLPGE